MAMKGHTVYLVSYLSHVHTRIWFLPWMWCSSEMEIVFDLYVGVVIQRAPPREGGRETHFLDRLRS